MAIELEIHINANREACWGELERLEDHVTWMADAEAITFHGEQRRGLGTAFRCATKVGPLRTSDEMLVVRWDEAEAIGVEHHGLFTGHGVFSLAGPQAGPTTLRWREEIRFPWWALGPLGALVARPVLRAIWRGNLRRLKRRIEA